jgi:hypothetical protein
VETVPPSPDPSKARIRAGARRPGPRAGLGRALVGVAALGALTACKQSMVVGEFKCLSEGAADGSAPSTTDPIAVPWQTGFENGMCDYTEVAGNCYRFPPVNFRMVDSPVHSGQYAAEITIVTGTDIGEQPQGRCYRQGKLPTEAYYGAWYLIPKTATNSGLWNLFRFQSNGSPSGLWDVHLANRPAGLSLELYSRFLSSDARYSQPIPIGRWFHVVLYLKRAKDKTGAVALYLDDQKAVEFTNLVTDDSDWAQWYVGNLATDLDPPECTVYLDDITIRSTL